MVTIVKLWLQQMIYAFVTVTIPFVTVQYGFTNDNQYAKTPWLLKHIYYSKGLVFIIKI